MRTLSGAAAAKVAEAAKVDAEIRGGYVNERPCLSAIESTDFYGIYNYEDMPLEHDGDANTHCSTKETANSVFFRHVFLNEWAAQRSGSVNR